MPESAEKLKSYTRVRQSGGRWMEGLDPGSEVQNLLEAYKVVMVLEGNVFIFLFVLGKEYNRAVAGNTDLVQKNRRSIRPFACSQRKYERKASLRATRNRPA